MYCYMRKDAKPKNKAVGQKYVIVVHENRWFTVWSNGVIREDVPSGIREDCLKGRDGFERFAVGVKIFLNVNSTLHSSFFFTRELSVQYSEFSWNKPVLKGSRLFFYKYGEEVAFQQLLYDRDAVDSRYLVAVKAPYKPKYIGWCVLPSWEFCEFWRYKNRGKRVPERLRCEPADNITRMAAEIFPIIPCSSFKERVYQ